MRPYEALPIPISFTSGETNEAFRALTDGHETWQEALHPEDRAGVEAAIARAQSLRERLRFNARLRGRDGAWLTMSADGVAIDDGTYVLTWQLTEDEHARVLEDRAQRQHLVANLGREILRGLPDYLAAVCEQVTSTIGAACTAIVEFDRSSDEAVISAMDGPFHMTSGTRVSLDEGRCRWTMAHPEPAITPDLDQETRFPIWKQARQAGARSSISVPIPSDDGPYGVLVTYGWRPRDYTPVDVDFLESVAHLLSAAIYRRRADREIAGQRQELTALVNHAPDLITRYDRDLTILFVNEVCRLGGWDPAQLAGRRLTDLGMPPDIENAWVSGVRGVFATGQPHDFETRSKDGRYLLEVRLVPELDEAGRVDRVLAISRDVTARRQAEEDRAQLQELLEQTRRATSVSRLGTTVAHEFNNVLMSISPFAEIIARGAQDDPRLLKAATYIRGAIVRGRRVTQDIMRYTRPATPALRTIDLATWLPRVVQANMQGSRVPLTLDAASVPTYAEVDLQQLEQVVANLLLNARESLADSLSGSIHVHLAGDEKSARITIADNGSGISSEHLDKVFDPFFTTKRTGTGLGLSVARQIVERHHGTIDVTSSIGAGTTLVITLPAPAARAAQEAPAIEETIRGRRLLLVEDEPAVSDGLVALLELGSAEVRVAATGKAALDELEAQLPEAVLLDVGLPDIDGVELFAVIRTRWPRLPIIFSTGHGDQARLDEMLRLPHVGHLVKPYDLDELTAAVANAIAG